MCKRVAVLGAGNGGQALAGDLSLRGFKVGLWETETFRKNIDPIKKNDNVLEVELLGELKEAKLDMISTDMDKVVADREIICISAPSFACDIITKELANYIKPQQVLLYCPGGTGNALAGAKILRENNKNNSIA